MITATTQPAANGFVIITDKLNPYNSNIAFYARKETAGTFQVYSWNNDNETPLFAIHCNNAQNKWYYRLVKDLKFSVADVVIQAAQAEGYL